MKKILRKVCVYIVLVGMILTQVCTNTYANDNIQFSPTSYLAVTKKWKKQNIKDSKNFQQDILVSSLKSNAEVQENVEGNKGQSVRLKKGTTIECTVDVETSGLYTLNLNYYRLSQGLVPLQYQLKVNNEYQYDEQSRLLLPVYWQSDKSDFEKDNKGNDVFPSQKSINQWQSTSLKDTTARHDQPLKIYLKQGKNTLDLEMISGEIWLSLINLQSPMSIDSYSNYARKRNVENNEALYTIEAEKPTYKNNTSCYPDISRDLEVKPYDTYKLMYNIFETSQLGDKVAYTIDVKKDGYYQLAFKINQSKDNAFVYRNIYIDNQILFKECLSYGFSQTDGWETQTLRDEKEKPFLVYLSKGKHILELETTGSPYEESVAQLLVINKEISDLSLDVKKIIGNQTDQYRDWELTKYMPHINDTFKDWKNQIKNIAEDIYKKNLNKKDESYNKLNSIINQFDELMEDPDSLPNHLGQLSEGTGSISQSLSDTISLLEYQPLSMDQIYVYGNEAKLPQNSVSFFASFNESCKRFFASFSSEDKEEEDVLEVWVNRNQNMVNLMQKMADEKFTKQTGVKVKFSIMPNEQKLILNQTSGEQPDVALGLSTTIPYEFAIRKTALDLSQFDDFEEVSERFSSGAFMSYTHDKGVYALPETQDFYVTFYRKDILSKLDIPVPQTWGEVTQILPELQRYGMNYYIPLAQSTGTKPFMYTAPFIYQNGGDIYNPKTMKVALDSENAIKGIKQMSELFTVYGLPLQVSSFYNSFRYGNIPIGVSTLADYQKLLTSSSELSGLWDIALHPGIEDEKGKIQRFAAGSAQSAMAFESSNKKDEAWEFLKWWTDTSTQTEFSNQLLTSYGYSYLWSSANLEAFSQLPIDEKHKETILEQWQYLIEVPKVPGGYMVERELSNVWNKIVFENKNPRAAIDSSLMTMNRELYRKLEEFGYVRDGKLIEKYHLPTVENIKTWGDKNDE